jgi:hypothetical protein
MTAREMIRKLTDHENHGKVVDRYIEIEKKTTSVMDRLGWILRLIVQPIYQIISILLYGSGTFKLLSLGQTMYSCITGWIEMIEFYNLGTTLMVWKILTHGLRVPLISVRSSDERHLLYKYAAGALFLLEYVR